MIQALKALFQKPVAASRPDFAALLAAAPGDVLVVDGALPAAGDWVSGVFAGATVVRQVSHAGEPSGLPFAESDAAVLPDHAGGWTTIVLVDVIDRLLDPAHGLAAARGALAPGGGILLLQAVAPDDPGARGDWNVLGRLRDTEHTWTPTRRQVRALPVAAGLTRGAEALWAEQVELACVRADTEAGLRAFAADIEGRGLIAEGRLAVTRLALVLTAS